MNYEENIEVSEIKTKNIRDNSVTQFNFDYTKEILEDKILQEILVMIETKQTLELADFKKIHSKKDVLYSIAFLENKIIYLEHLQESFKLQDLPYRFVEISKILDAITTEQYKINIFSEFSTKVSLILDILYMAKNSIYNVYEVNSI